MSSPPRGTTTRGGSSSAKQIPRSSAAARSPKKKASAGLSAAKKASASSSRRTDTFFAADRGGAKAAAPKAAGGQHAGAAGLPPPAAASEEGAAGARPLDLRKEVEVPLASTTGAEQDKTAGPPAVLVPDVEDTTSKEVVPRPTAELPEPTTVVSTSSTSVAPAPPPPRDPRYTSTADVTDPSLIDAFFCFEDGFQLPPDADADTLLKYHGRLMPRYDEVARYYHQKSQFVGADARSVGELEQKLSEAREAERLDAESKKTMDFGKERLDAEETMEQGSRNYIAVLVHRLRRTSREGRTRWCSISLMSAVAVVTRSPRTLAPGAKIPKITIVRRAL